MNNEKRPSVLKMFLVAMLLLLVGLYVQCFYPNRTNAQQKKEQPTPTPQVVIIERQPAWLADWYQLNFEREKLEKKIPTDTFTIHHTGLEPGITWRKLSDIQKERLYVPRFNSNDPDPYVKGQPPYSGHFRLNEKGVLEEVFYAYHWIVRQDGTVEELLPVTEVGWHAGDWNENMRSLAIVLDGDFSKTEPPIKMLEAVAKIMSDTAKKFPMKRLKQHKDSRKTECPGAWYDKRWGRARTTGREKLLYLSKLKLE